MALDHQNVCLHGGGGDGDGNGASMVVEQGKQQLVKISSARTPSNDDDSYGGVRVSGSVAGNTGGTGTAVAGVDDDDEGVMMNVVHYYHCCYYGVRAMEENMKKVMTSNDDCCGYGCECECDGGTVADVADVVALGVSMV